MTRAGLVWLVLAGCRGAIRVADDSDTDAPVGGDTASDTDEPCEPSAEAPNLADDDCDGLVDEDFVAEGAVVVTEVMIAPGAAVETVGEWLEVENRGSASVDLIGWQLLSDPEETWVIPDSLRLEPGERAVLGVSGDPDANGGIIIDAAYERASVSFANGPDAVSLAIQDRVISAVSWDDAEIGASLSRDPELQDRWCASATPLPSGDRGTPGQPNQPCGNVDRDGDGWTPDDGDCDDADPSVAPAAPETWNGSDDDCDGDVDDVTIDGIAIGWLDGGPDERLGFASALSVGDLDDDGADDLILGGEGVGPDGYGGAYLVHAYEGAGASGTAAAAAFETAAGGRSSGLSSLGPRQSDVTGDGVADLVMAGRGSLPQCVVFDQTGGGPDQRVFYPYADRELPPRVASDGDLDGDGVAEIVATGKWVYPNGMRIYVVNLPDLPSGATSLFDTVPYLQEDTVRDDLGKALSTGDLDGDGYDDILTTAPDAAPNGTSSGYAYFVRGGAEPVDSGAIGDAAAGRIAGLVPGGAFGLSGGPAIFDADGDGAMDVAIGSIPESTVWVFDANALYGEHTTDDARAVLTAEGQPAWFGGSMAAGDLDGDGKSELLVAATDDAEEYTGIASSPDEPGAVFIFGADALDGGVFDTSVARLLLGEADGDLFGTSLSLPDLDGDGDADLMVASPGRDDGAGRVWFTALD